MINMVTPSENRTQHVMTRSVPSDLWHRVKVQAARQGIARRELVINAIRSEIIRLEREEKCND